MSDIDEKAQRAARVKRFLTHLDLAERAAHFGYWRFDLRTNAYYWSPGMYRLLGEDPNARHPDTEWLYAQMTPESRATVEKALETAIRTRSPFSYRTISRNPHRSAHIVETQGEVEIGEDGRTTALLGVCHDVTAQAQAEEAREKAQQRYRLMTEESGDIIILYSANEELLFASNALERMLGRTGDEIRDGGYRRFVHPDDMQEAAKIIERPVDSDMVVGTWRLRHRDGHYVWLETTIRTIYDPISGKPLNVVSVSRDVSARREQELAAQAARERAEAANKAKSEFLANMSHELRTPLNAILGFSDLMRQEMFGPLGGTRYAGYAGMIYDSGELLLDLITDMLDMAKIEAGKLELNLEDVELKPAIDEAMRLLWQRAEEKKLSLAVEVDESLPLVHADRRAVKQIVINLAGNAIKFTPKGGSVRVVAEVSGGAMNLSVVDTGIGIPASEIDRLGRPFEQVNGNPVLAKAGTGLGLALVRALAEKHGGRLIIESDEGVGTRVSVTFPLAGAKAAAA
jgi:PAS domain S-box-containing protein